jgi:hypothetical protein
MNFSREEMSKTGELGMIRAGLSNPDMESSEIPCRTYEDFHLVLMELYDYYKLMGKPQTPAQP